MSYKDASVLVDFGLFHFGRIVFSNGRVSPYVVKLPKHCPDKLFTILSEIAWQHEQLRTLKNVHFIGIAKSGVPLARAISKCKEGLSIAVKVSVVNPHLDYEELNECHDNAEVILVDNAVTSGATAGTVLKRLQQFGYQPKAILRIFDRQDLGTDGLTTAGRIKDLLGLDLISILNLEDLLPRLKPEEQDLIMEYQSSFGSESFKQKHGG
jgi:orotate phosphoribosyltransferase